MPGGGSSCCACGAVVPRDWTARWRQVTAIVGRAARNFLRTPQEAAFAYVVQLYADDDSDMALAELLRLSESAPLVLLHTLTQLLNLLVSSPVGQYARRIEYVALAASSRSIFVAHRALFFISAFAPRSPCLTMSVGEPSPTAQQRLLRHAVEIQGAAAVSVHFSSVSGSAGGRWAPPLRPPASNAAKQRVKLPQNVSPGDRSSAFAAAAPAVALVSSLSTPPRRGVSGALGDAAATASGAAMSSATNERTRLKSYGSITPAPAPGPPLALDGHLLGGVAESGPEASAAAPFFQSRTGDAPAGHSGGGTLLLPLASTEGGRTRPGGVAARDALAHESLHLGLRALWAAAEAAAAASAVSRVAVAGPAHFPAPHTERLPAPDTAAIAPYSAPTMTISTPRSARSEASSIGSGPPRLSPAGLPVTPGAAASPLPFEAAAAVAGAPPPFSLYAALPMGPRPELSSPEERLAWFGEVPALCGELVEISRRLLPEPIPARNPLLRQLLAAVHAAYLPSHALYAPVGNLHNSLLAIHPAESFSFKTATRVPFMVVLEVVRGAGRRGLM